MSRRFAASAVALASAFVAAVAFAGVAVAAPVYQVQVWPQGDPSRPEMVLLIASVDLGPSVALPATVRIPFPEGAVVAWAGEITGGSAETDIRRSYEITKTAGGSVLVMTVETTGNAQFDAWWVPVVSDGKSASARVVWRQTEPAQEVEFMVRMPPGARDVRIEPAPEGRPVTNQVGETLYTLPSQTMEPGDELAVSFSFVQRGASGGPGADGGASPIRYVFGILAVLVVALLAVAAVERRKQREAPTLDV